MDAQDHIVGAEISGVVTVYQIWYSKKDRNSGQRRVDRLFTRRNKLQTSWGTIAAQTIGRGNRNYRINAMYLEYENVADPGDVISPPAYGRDGALDYYQSLALSADRDFLRVPLLVEPGISVDPEYVDLLDSAAGNRVTYMAQTQGTTGVHGKSFNDSVNSKVFGVALAATPDYSDPSKDVILARAYFATPNEQVPKLASSQIGISWDITFGTPQN